MVNRKQMVRYRAFEIFRKSYTIIHESWIMNEIIHNNSWMMNHEWYTRYFMNKYTIIHEWWIMNDESWMMNHEWWIMNDESFMMNHEWWIMNERYATHNKQMGNRKQIVHHKQRVRYRACRIDRTSYMIHNQW